MCKGPVGLGANLTLISFIFLDLRLQKYGFQMIYGKENEKSLPKLSRLWRYLADSNRRPRFCRPIPNHSGKVPY